MRTRPLGAHGPAISVVGFGAAEIAMDEHLGPRPAEDEAVAVVRGALDAGLTWVDTAEGYGNGLSERLVGRALQGRREGVVLATKVGPRPGGSGHARDDIRRACEASLERLGTDWIDLYQLHWPDETGVPLEETWEAMAALVDDGLVRAIGVSNYRREQIERLLAVRHVDSLQPQLSMLCLAERELARWCGEQGIGVVAYGPLAYGLLSGTIGPDTRFQPSDWRAGGLGWSTYDELFAPGRLERSLAVLERLRPIAARLGLSLPQLVLAWTCAQDGVTAAIVGSTSVGHLAENAAGGDVDLDAATLAEIEAALPLGPAFV